MGSAQDLNYSKDALEFAVELGKLIAESGNILVYGAEKPYSSLSTNAAISANKNNGLTVGITDGKDKSIYGDFRPDILIPCGLEIGGGREFTLVLSCDVIIAISGGSGTLTEMAIAYQAGIPIIVVDKFGGWAKKLANKFFDSRKQKMENYLKELYLKSRIIVKKHDKINWHIINIGNIIIFSFVRYYNRLINNIFVCIHKLRKKFMIFILLARIDFNRNNAIIIFIINDKIYLTFNITIII